MSIESLLEQNINAQRDLIAAVNLLTAALGSKDAGTRPAAPVKASEPAPAAPVKTSESPAAAPAGTALDYEKDVKPKVLEVSSRKGRDACMAVLGKFGLASAKAAKPEQYADIIKACEEALK